MTRCTPGPWARTCIAYVPHSELHPPVFSTEEAESLRQQNADRFVDIGHERRAAIYLPFLEKLATAEVAAR